MLRGYDVYHTDKPFFDRASGDARGMMLEDILVLENLVLTHFTLTVIVVARSSIPKSSPNPRHCPVSWGNKNLESFWILRARALLVIRKSRREFWIQFISTLIISTIKVWDDIRTLRSSKNPINNIPALLSNGSLVSSPVEVVNVLGSMFATISSTAKHSSEIVVLPKASYVAIQIIIASICINHNQAHIDTNIFLPTSLNQCVVKLCSSNLAGVRLLLVSVPNWRQLNLKQDGAQDNSDDNQLVGEDTFDKIPSRFMQTFKEIIGQLLMMLNQEFTWSIMIPGLKITHNIFTVEAIDAYLILLDMCGDQCILKALVKHLNILSSEESWNPRARFVVVVVVDENLVWSYDINLFDDLVRQILEKMWAEYIYSTTVILPVMVRNVTREGFLKHYKDSGSKKFIGIYSWFPYKEKGKCARNVENVKLLDLCSKTNYGYFLSNSDPSRFELPKTLHNCPLMITAFEYDPYVLSQQNDSSTTYGVNFDDGLEIRLLRFIADFLKFQIVFQKPPTNSIRWGRVLPNGTMTGLIADISYKKSDIVFTACELVSMKTKMNFESTHHYFRESLIWLVPCARPIPRWRSLSRIFSPMLWLMVFLSFFLGSSFFWIFSKLSKPSSANLLSVGKSFEITWATILEVTANNELYSAAFRIFFLHWLFYCLIVNSVYRSFLIGVLADPGKQHQIETVEDILKSGMDIGFPATLDGLFEASNDWQYLEILKRRIDLSDYTYYYNRIANNENFAGITDKLHTEYMSLFKFLDQNGNPSICLFKDGVNNYFVTMWLSKGNPILFRVNQIISRIIQGGFIDLWVKDLLTMARLKSLMTQDFNSSGSSYVMTISHLQGAFFLLSMGLILGLLLFIWELKRNAWARNKVFVRNSPAHNSQE
uniref:Ionotropic glutamate receptor C-terminal domain-containing protein n=1 Tax=Timema cristinae TaxID=61476 RepID=A0A7R9DFE2_TIMCR|nr:unnamed protein product [Timema cristinae]